MSHTLGCFIFFVLGRLKIGAMTASVESLDMRTSMPHRQLHLSLVGGRGGRGTTSRAYLYNTHDFAILDVAARAGVRRDGDGDGGSSTGGTGTGVARGQRSSSRVMSRLSGLDGMECDGG